MTHQKKIKKEISPKMIGILCHTKWTYCLVQLAVS